MNTGVTPGVTCWICNSRPAAAQEGAPAFESVLCTPVRAPEGHPWHPTRQRKIVKLSPYKGDTQPLVARRDLRI